VARVLLESTLSHTSLQYQTEYHSGVTIMYPKNNNCETYKKTKGKKYNKKEKKYESLIS